MLASGHYDSPLGYWLDKWYPLARVLIEVCFRGLSAVLDIFSLAESNFSEVVIQNTCNFSSTKICITSMKRP
jgi:hypothetical protein